MGAVEEFRLLVMNAWNQSLPFELRQLLPTDALSCTTCGVGSTRRNSGASRNRKLLPYSERHSARRMRQVREHRPHRSKLAPSIHSHPFDSEAKATQRQPSGVKQRGANPTPPPPEAFGFKSPTMRGIPWRPWSFEKLRYQEGGREKICRILSRTQNLPGTLQAYFRT